FLSRVGATMSLSRASGNRKISIPLTPLAKADTVTAWKIRNLALARITRAHSKKWTNGSAPRRVVAPTSAACGWPGGFVCGCCGVTGEPWVMARGIFRCKACHGNTPLTAGTAMRATRGGRQIGSTRRPNRGTLRVLPAPSRTSLARRQCVSLSPAPPHGVVGVPKKNQISCRQVDSETRDPCCDCRRCQAFPMSSSLVPYRGKSRLQHSYITVKAAVEIMGKKPHAPHLRHQFGARSPLPYSHFSASQIAFNMLSNARFAAVTQSLYSLAL